MTLTNALLIWIIYLSFEVIRSVRRIEILGKFINHRLEFAVRILVGIVLSLVYAGVTFKALYFLCLLGVIFSAFFDPYLNFARFRPIDYNGKGSVIDRIEDKYLPGGRSVSLKFFLSALLLFFFLKLYEGL